jgi:hyperosmotically inducible protein
MKGRLVVFVGLLSLLALPAPASADAFETGKQEGAVRQAEKGARSAAEAISDGWITMKVHAQFLDEDPLEDSDIDVDTNSGIVTLSGTVVTEAGRKRAVEIAKATDGVKNVVDNLRIGREEGATGTAGRESDRPTGKVVSDGWIKSKIYSQFLAEDPLDESNIDIDVDEGTVTLEGTVQTTAARSRAEAIARKTDGVRNVKNELKVGPAK